MTCLGMYCDRIVMDGQNLVTAIVVSLKHYSVCVSGGQCREEGRRPTMHVVNMLCMLIHIIHYLHYRFSVSCKSNAHIVPPIHASCNCEIYKYYFTFFIHAFFPIIFYYE